MNMNPTPEYLGDDIVFVQMKTCFWKFKIT